MLSFLRRKNNDVVESKVEKIPLHDVEFSNLVLKESWLEFMKVSRYLNTPEVLEAKEWFYTIENHEIKVHIPNQRVPTIPDTKESKTLLQSFLELYLNQQDENCTGHPNEVIETFSMLYLTEKNDIVTSLKTKKIPKDFGMLEVIQKCSKWRQNQFMMIRHGLLHHIISLVHECIYLIVPSETEITEFILKAVIGPSLVTLANFFSVPNTLLSFAFSSTNLIFQPIKFSDLDEVMIFHLLHVHQFFKCISESIEILARVTDEVNCASSFGLLEYILHIVRKLLHFQHKHQISVEFCKSVLVLLSWPTESKKLSQKQSQIISSVDLLSWIDQDWMENLYELRILTLRIIRESVLKSDGLLSVMLKYDLIRLVLDLGLWIGYFFSITDYDSMTIALADNLDETPDVLSYEKFNLTHNRVELPPPRFIRKVANKKALHFFEILDSFVSQNPLCDSKQFHQLSKESRSNYSELSLVILNLMKDPANDSCAHTLHARQKLKLAGDFQLYFHDRILQLISGNLSFFKPSDGNNSDEQKSSTETKTPRESVLNHFVSHDLYSIYFSEYFYFFGGKSNKLNLFIRKRHDFNEPLFDDDTNRAKVSELTCRVIRHSVIKLIEYVATRNSPNLKQSDVEDTSPKELSQNLEVCRKILFVLGSFNSNPYLVAELGEALCTIIQSSYLETMKSLEELHAVSIVSFIVKIQHENVSKLEKEDSMYEITKRARFISLNCLAYLLESKENLKDALQDPNALNTLFLCLFDVKLKEFAFKKINVLMTLESDEMQVEMYSNLVQSYGKSFQKITHDPSSENLHLLLDMLGSIQYVLSGPNSKLLQKKFRSIFDDLLQLFSLHSDAIINAGLSPHSLVIEIFKTFNVLVSNNHKSQQRFMKTAEKSDLMLQMIVNQPIEHKIDLNLMFKELFDIMVDGTFDIETNYTIKNPYIVPLMFELSLYASETTFIEVMSKFLSLTTSSVRNRHYLCQVGVLGTLLKLITPISEKFDQNRLVKTATSFVIDLLIILGKHSISVKELKQLFYLLKQHSDDVPSQLLGLLFNALQKMTQTTPSHYFNFDLHDSGLELPVMDGFPSKRGYAVHAWVRLHESEDMDVNRTFFQFTKGDRGLRAYFLKSQLVVAVNRKVHAIFKHKFQMNKWYFLGIVHEKSTLFRPAAVSLYINGHCSEKKPLNYPQSRTVDCCRLGTSNENEVLFGNLSSFYFYDEVLDENTLANIFYLGSRYTSGFQSIDEGRFPGNSLLFDGTLANKLRFCFNAKAFQNNHCYNLALGRHPASSKLLRGSQLCISTEIKDIVGCLGGIKVLFPLFTRIDKLSHTERADSIDHYLINSLILLHLEMLRDHRENIFDMVRCKGFQIIGFLLKSVSPKHLTQRTVHLIPNLINTISNSPVLLQQVIDYILLDMRVWIYTPVEVQLELFDFLVKELESDNDNSQKYYFRQHSVQRLLDSMRLYYWIEKDEFSMGSHGIKNAQGEILGVRPNTQDILKIRAYILEFIKKLICDGPTPEEVKSIISFFYDAKDLDQIRDVLLLTLKLMIDSKNLVQLMEYIAVCHGYEAFNHLLTLPDEKVRVLALKCLGQFLIHHPKYRLKIHADEEQGFAYVENALKFGSYSETVYRALRDILLGQVSVHDGAQCFEKEKLDPQISVTCTIHAIICLMQQSSWETLGVVLENFSKQVKIVAVKEAILKQEFFQYELFNLYDRIQESKDKSGSDQFMNLVMDILLEVLFYALINQKRGWEHVDRTVCYLYASKKFHPKLTEITLRRILDGLLDMYIRTARDEKENKLQGKLLQQVKNSETYVLDNFLRLLNYIEDYLFHSRCIQANLKKGYKVKSETNLLRGFQRLVQRDRSSSISNNPQSNPNSKSPNTQSFNSVENDSVLHADSYSPNGTLLTEDGTTSSEISGHPSPLLDTKRSPSIHPKPSPEIRSSPQLENRLHRNFKFQYFDGYLELRKDKDGLWIDIGIAQKIIRLLEFWDLIILSFGSIKKYLESTKSLRKGGTMRLILNLIRYSLTSHYSVFAGNLETIETIVQLDIETESSIQRFSELWEITGDLRENHGFEDRILYILSFLTDAADHLIGQEKYSDAQRVLNTIKTLFEKRKPLLQSKFLREHNSQLFSEKFMFYDPNAEVTIEKYQNLKNGKQAERWQRAKETFQKVAKKMGKQDYELMKIIVEQKRKKISDAQKAFENYHRTLSVKLSKLKEEYSSRKKEEQEKEYERMKREHSRFEESEKLAATYVKKLIRELSNERGAWGSKDSDVKWKLDRTENCQRMRLKLKRDYRGIDHKGAALTKFAKEDVTVHRIQTTPNSEQFISEALQFPKYKPVEDEEVEEDEEDDVIFFEEDQKEKSLLKGYCELVTPMQSFSAEYELTTNRIIINVDKENKAETFGITEKNAFLLQTPKDRIINIDDLREVHLRRYKLRKTGLELFLMRRISVFMNFHQKHERNRFFKKVLRLKPSNVQYIPSKIRAPHEYMSRSNMTKMWRRGEISNFDYLMYINTIANRTYADLSQYPVFPWILQDYKSDTLDLNDSSIYRDLSKPVGAINEKRLEESIIRYESFCDPHIPKFHYGSHYSSPGIVLYFLIRLEPFTTYFRILQGGKFDHADRMLDSIAQTWENCLKSSDNKELIPEYFYLPECLEIHNDLNLGYKHNGEQLGRVMLPPWANGSAAEFIRIHREALESDYVSQNLHKWIDLIFGCKQRGPKAIEAVNVFYYLTYEGCVDLDDIKDDSLRKSTISQIQNFGQTPSQIFLKEHPRKYTLQEMQELQILSNATQEPILISRKLDTTTPIIHIIPSAEKVRCISKSGIIFVLKFSITNPKIIENDVFQRKFAIDALFSNDVQLKNTTFALPYGKSLEDVLYSVGHWDFSIRSSKMGTNFHCQMVQARWQHRDLVSSICISEDDKYLVTGSRDTTVMIWTLDKYGNISEDPLHILYGHDDEITSVSCSSDLDIVVSASKDGSAVVHQLWQGVYVRSIYHPNNLPIDLCAVNSQGIFLYSDEDKVIWHFSINGKFRSKFETEVSQCCLLIQDEYLFYVCKAGQIVAMRIYDHKIIRLYRTKASVIKTMTIMNNYLFVGTNLGLVILNGLNDSGHPM